jgi:HD domain
MSVEPTDGPPAAPGPSAGPGPSGPSDLATGAYIALVAALGLGLTTYAITTRGLVIDSTLVVLAFVAVLTWWSGPPVDSQFSITFDSIISLAAMALVGPAGAGVVGIISGPLERGPLSMRARVFNLGMTSTYSVLGGYAYIWAGGRTDSTDLRGAEAIIRYVGVPILVADLVQVAVNLVLLVGVIRLSSGEGSMRVRAWQLLRSTGPSYLGYGIVAFLLVVLWEPADLGPASVVLVLAPLLVARWAYAQFAEEAKAHAQALDVLVAAVEAKAPHLVGHSARVAELSGWMGEHLGLRPHTVADTRVAGLLHDLGQTTLPTALVRGTGLGTGSALDTYPARGVEALRGISFLSGSLDAVGRHREALHRPAPGAGPDPALVLGAADEFDLLTAVGTPDGALLGADEAVARLRTAPGMREDVVRALEHALVRRRTTVTP